MNVSGARSIRPMGIGSGPVSEIKMAMAVSVMPTEPYEAHIASHGECSRDLFPRVLSSIMSGSGALSERASGRNTLNQSRIKKIASAVMPENISSLRLIAPQAIHTTRRIPILGEGGAFADCVETKHLAGIELAEQRKERPMTGCPGPMVWFAVGPEGHQPEIIMECDCGYTVIGGDTIIDRDHHDTPLLAEGLAA